MWPYAWQMVGTVLLRWTTLWQMMDLVWKRETTLFHCQCHHNIRMLALNGRIKLMDHSYAQGQKRKLFSKKENKLS